MNDSTDDARRIQAIGRKVVEELQQHFVHSSQDARRLFEDFHAATKDSRGWMDADYYDHEGALGLALEVEFFRQFGPRIGRGAEFLEWRKAVMDGWRKAGER
jgi:hypothetical protein